MMKMTGGTIRLSSSQPREEASDPRNFPRANA